MLASEVRVAIHGGARVKCTQGWLNERTPSGQRSLELLSEDDERYLAYIRAEAEDENGNKTYTYRVKVVTSDIKYAGTDSSVFVCIFGVEGDTGTKKLVTKKRFVDLFERGSVDEFEVVTDADLGPIQRLHLSTDGRGLGAGWHCASVTIIQPDGTSVYFPCNQWFDETQVSSLPPSLRPSVRPSSWVTLPAGRWSDRKGASTGSIWRTGARASSDVSVECTDSSQHVSPLCLCFSVCRFLSLLVHASPLCLCLSICRFLSFLVHASPLCLCLSLCLCLCLCLCYIDLTWAGGRRCDIYL